MSIRRHAFAIMLLITLILNARGGQPAKVDLQQELRSLEKRIAAVRGLEFKKPVQARVIARPEDAGKGIQGFYSPREKTLFLYDDVKGSYRQGVLIHEMVHALQDQHFDLLKLKAQLHKDIFGSDAELALAALIEGDATFTMIEVLKKDSPKVEAMLDVMLAEQKNLQNAFLYSQGARYVKALKDKGGWASVNSAYKFPPRATASIFNLSSVMPIDLGTGKTRGAFAIFKSLAEDPKTRAIAEQIARDWRGDVTTDSDAGQASIMWLANPESARLLGDGLKQVPHEANVLFTVAGRRVYTLIPRLGADPGALIDRMAVLPVTVYAVKDKRKISFGEMTERLLEADLICIGETHNSDPHHRIQLRIIKGLFAFDERLGVGMEMFQRPFQKELDRYFRGETTEEEFLKASEYKQRWGFDWDLYKPIVDFCRSNKLPLSALNAPKELTSRISKVGFAGLKDDEKLKLGDIDFHVKVHRDYWFDRLDKLHGPNFKSTPEQKERSYQVMTIWDDYMAQSAALFLKQRTLRRLVVLAGSGHIDRGIGIPQRTIRRTGGKVATVHFTTEAEAAKAIADPPADYIVILQ